MLDEMTRLLQGATNKGIKTLLRHPEVKKSLISEFKINSAKLPPRGPGMGYLKEINSAKLHHGAQEWDI